MLAELLPKATTVAKVEFLQVAVQAIVSASLDRMVAKSLLDELRAKSQAFDADDQKLVLARVAEAKEEDEDDRKPVEILLDIGMEDQLFYDEKRDAFAAVTENDVRDVLRIGGSEYKQHLAYEYHRVTGSAAGSENIDNVCLVLAATAVRRGECKTLHKRFAVVDGAVWIARGDPKRTAIKVTADGWELVARPPVLFELQPHQQAHPVPEGGGNLRALLSPFFNFARPEDEALFLSWMVAAMIENVPRAALIIKGAPGSAKSTTAKLGRTCLDPSAVDALSLGNADAAQTAQILCQHEIPVFDNVTYLTKDQEPLFCVAITRGAYSKRTLYTDAGSYIFRLACAPILTGINSPTEAADLLDRAVLVELEYITKEARKEDAAIWRDFEALRPKVFGALLDVLVKAMKIHPTVQLPSLPRLADWARWTVAAAEAMGYGRDLILKALQLNESSQAEAALEDPVGQALRTMMSKCESWSGTAAALYDKLVRIHGDPKRGDRWPAGVSPMAKRLRVLLPPLAAIGIDIVFMKSGEERTILIGKKGTSATKPVTLADDDERRF